MSPEVTLDVCLKPEEQNDKRCRCKGFPAYPPPFSYDIYATAKFSDL